MLDCVLASRCFEILQEDKNYYYCKYRYNDSKEFEEDLNQINLSYPGKIKIVNPAKYSMIIRK